MSSDNSGEIWVPIECLGGRYAVSNLGNVRNQSSGCVLKPIKNKKSGFLYVSFHGNPKKKVYIHKAVAEAFVPNTDGCMYVRHRNGDKSDNRSGNLEWHTKCASRKEKKVRLLKWTVESCTEAARLCSSATDFRERFPGGYRYAHQTDLWRSFTWFKHNTDPNRKTYVVYAYEDVANNAVYIGLTNNLDRREKEHRKKNYKNGLRKYDIVRQHFEDVGLPIPKPIVLRDGMDGFEAQAAEDEFKSKYASGGWSVVNTGKTGLGVSSLGNLAYKRPGRDECAEIVKGCRSRKELRLKSHTAYTTIIMNGWEDLLPPKKGNLNDSDWRMLVSGYEDRGDLMQRNHSLYVRLLGNGLLDKYLPSEYAGMDDGRIVEVARGYGDRYALRLKAYELYRICCRRKLLNTVFPKPSKKPKVVCTASFEECSDIASGFEFRYQVRKARPEIFRRMKDMGWLGQIMPYAAGSVWTEESAVEFCSGFDNRTEMREKSASCYEFLRKRGLLGKVFPKKVVRATLLFDAPISECINRAELCSGWYQFKTKYQKYASLCIRKGWDMDVMAVFAEKKRTAEAENERKAAVKMEETMAKCHDCAKSCSTKKEFREKYPTEYSFASRHKLLKDYTWLKGCKGEKDDEKKRLAEETARMYTKKKDFREKSPYEYGLAVRLKILKSFDWLS